MRGRGRGGRGSVWDDVAAGKEGGVGRVMARVHLEVLYLACIAHITVI